jgi:SAM-dependent methyltransferase
LHQATEIDVTRPRNLLRTSAALMFAAIAVCGLAHAQAQTYQPREYQPGKDVVWVPTAQTLVDKMLDAAKLTADDYLVDLGSGDGRTVITAAQRGAKALGVEYNPKMVELSKENAKKAGVSERATFLKADLFKTDFSKATVVTLFLLPEINLQLRPVLLDMKPGTRVVSNSFDMGDWTADETIETVDKCMTYCNAFLWIIPAKVGGNWRSDDGQLTFKQTFQVLSGTVKSGNVLAPLKGRLLGEDVTFTAGPTTYKGRVNGTVIEGTSTTDGKPKPWRATRT